MENFHSLVTDSTLLLVETWGNANRITAESLRCCKRDTLPALKAARRFVKHNFQVTLDVPATIICRYSLLNQECIGERCPFHPGKNEERHAPHLPTPHP